MDFAQARYYAKNLGRFNSVDPIFFAAERLIDPQQINLYQYSRNNPLAFIDPEGLKVKVSDKTADQTGADDLKQRINGRKDALFQVAYGEKNKLIIVDSKGDEIKGDALKKLGKNLTGGEKELFKAITDDTFTATIDVFRGSDKVDFGTAIGKAENAVDLNDLDILDKSKDSDVNSGRVIGHEILEAFSSAMGSSDPHGDANTFFPGLDKTEKSEYIGDPNIQRIGFTTLYIPVHNTNKTLVVGKKLTNPSPYKTTSKGIKPTGDTTTGNIFYTQIIPR